MNRIIEKLVYLKSAYENIERLEKIKTKNEYCKNLYDSYAKRLEEDVSCLPQKYRSGREIEKLLSYFVLKDVSQEIEEVIKNLEH